MKLINLFGGPGVGKSTTRALLFANLKIKGFNVEEVVEYAKDKVWEGHFNVLEDRLYMLAKQNRRIHRLRNQVDVCVNDSPILLCNIYGNKTFSYNNDLEQLVFSIHESYDNVNVVLTRKTKFQQSGRVHGEEQSVQLDKNVVELLQSREYSFLIHDILDGVEVLLEKIIAVV